MKTILFRLLVTISFGCLTLFATSIPAGAQTYVSTVLHSFGNNTSGDGQYPQYGHLIADGSGNLYGTTSAGGANGYGTVFELVNSSGTYTEKVLYSFAGTPDGDAPLGSLIMDASGNLYGNTYYGGVNDHGTVFELVNSSGTYTEKVLYSFAGTPYVPLSDGVTPEGGVIMDGSGNLYGTTQMGGTGNGGTVFELVNSSGTYTEKVLYNLNTVAEMYPYAGLIIDGSGNLYGTTGAPKGTVFELVNFSGTYTARVLHTFQLPGPGPDGSQPAPELIVDGSGNLYGTTTAGGTNNCGTVFELAAPLSAGMNDVVLHSFNNGGDACGNPAGLSTDASGNLYGTAGGGANGYGTVFELVNSSGTYTEKVLYSFASTDAYPNPGVIMDASGNLYGTTNRGGTYGYGSVFELSSASGLCEGAPAYTGFCLSNTLGAPAMGLIPFGVPGDIAVSGRWAAATGPTTYGVYRPSNQVFYLATSLGASQSTIDIPFGIPGDIPIAGDWNGDGITEVGVYRPSNQTFYLRYSATRTEAIVFGTIGDMPLAGDWDGDGLWSPGVYRPSNSTFYLTNQNTAGSPAVAWQTTNFGIPGDRPIVGDWDGNGTTTIGVVRGANEWFLTNQSGPNFTSGFAEYDFLFGVGGDQFITGDWDGNGTFTPGAYRSQ